MPKASRRSLLSRLLISTSLPFAALAFGTVGAHSQSLVSNTGTAGTPGTGDGGAGGPGGPITVDNGYTTSNTNA